jgi:TolB protein
VTKLRWIACLLWIALPVAAAAQTDVWPDPVVKEDVFVVPLWLPQFQGAGEHTPRAQRIEQIVLQDLQFSGLFKIMREEPATAGVAGINAVVVRGRVFGEGPDVTFEGTVTDIASGDFVGGKKYKVTDKESRRVAHLFADEIVRLVTGEKGVASTQIVYTRKVSDKWELVVSDYDGYNPRVLVRQTVPLLAPRWIDRNQAIAYTSFRDGKADLFTRVLSENKSRGLANYSGSNTAVEWSDKQGMLLAALSKDGNTETYMLARTGNIQQRLTHNKAIDTSPGWSPGGREIVFLSDRSGTPQLYLMDRDGSNVRRLTFTGGYNASPAWSPRGDLIAFSTRMGAEFQIAIITPDGRDGRLITKDNHSHEDPRWAPDGRHLVCTERGRGESVSVVDIVTGGKRILAQGSDPDWSTP